MSFVSYAENFEDAILWRAFTNIERGFYIDIGAQDPVVDLVSLSLYEQNWRGVRREPVPQLPQCAALLRADRPDDTVLEAAATATAGRQVLPVLQDTGASTFNGALAARHERSCHAWSA